MSDQSAFHESLYNTISCLIPVRSFRIKILIVSLIAIHVPLLALIGFLLAYPEDIPRLHTLLVTLAATLFSTMVAWWLLCHLLEPVSLVSDALRDYASEGRINLPDTHDKELGPFLHEVDTILRKIDGRAQTLQELAFNDYLTELPNRRYAEDRLHSEVPLCTRNRIPLTIAMLDVDYFKHINDTYGHVAGDDVLVRLARYIRSYLRRKSDWIARWGGEEFIIVLFASPDDARDLMEDLREGLTRCRFHSDGIAHELTVSIGLATHRGDDAIKTTIKNADNALYQAKAAGRNTVLVWSETAV